LEKHCTFDSTEDFVYSAQLASDLYNMEKNGYSICEVKISYWNEHLSKELDECKGIKFIGTVY